MKIEIEISDEDAACLWADQFAPRPTVAQIVKRLAKDSAAGYRRAFPESVPQALEDFRKVQGTEEVAS